VALVTSCMTSNPAIAQVGAFFWTIPIDGKCRRRVTRKRVARATGSTTSHSTTSTTFFTADRDESAGCPLTRLLRGDVEGRQTTTSGSRTTDFDFTGTFVASDATITFTVWNDGGRAVVYTSDPGGAEERGGPASATSGNGVFF